MPVYVVLSQMCKHKIILGSANNLYKDAKENAVSGYLFRLNFNIALNYFTAKKSTHHSSVVVLTELVPLMNQQDLIRFKYISI